MNWAVIPTLRLNLVFNLSNNCNITFSRLFLLSRSAKDILLLYRSHILYSTPAHVAGGIIHAEDGKKSVCFSVLYTVYFSGTE